MNNLIESLPDFDDMDKMVKVATVAKAELEHNKFLLEQYVANLIGLAMIDERHWVNGKPPTASYCDKVISVKGLDKDSGERIQKFRDMIIEQEKEYTEAKLLLDNMKSRISVWQTHSANGRKVNV